MYTFLVAKKSFKQNGHICFLGNIPCLKSDPKRLQISESEYILPPFVIAHSCHPNSYIDWHVHELKALKHIQKGEIITYHYGTSEDDYQIGKFNCSCGSKLCVGIFKGFAYMTKEERMGVKDYVSPYLKKKYF